MKVITKCLTCDTDFSWYKYDDKPEKKYCSNKCYGHAVRRYNELTNRITKSCKYCNTEFIESNTVNGNKREFCSKRCMYENRKAQSHHTISCSNCGVEITDYKIKKRRMFCSPDCLRTSEWKRDKTRQQMLHNNPMLNPASIQKIKDTKLERYGDPNYNNQEKNAETMISKYGIKYAFDLRRSNGIGISKPQRKYYEQIKQQYPDAILEHYLSDVHVSVDIFIPSENRIVEIYGDYWHCNPKLFLENSYHSQLHMNAADKWKIDLERQAKLEFAGYTVDIIWESDII